MARKVYVFVLRVRTGCLHTLLLVVWSSAAWRRVGVVPNLVCVAGGCCSGYPQMASTPAALGPGRLKQLVPMFVDGGGGQCAVALPN